jgi:hypothetical protein
VRWQPTAVVGATTANAPSVVRADPAPAAGPIAKILQRRKLGATFRNVRRILDEMKADGSYDEFVRVDENGQTIVDVSALAVEVASKLKVQNPGSWWEDIDWEALFAFIERLITLLISLFGFVCLNLRAVKRRLLHVFQWLIFSKGKP